MSGETDTNGIADEELSEALLPGTPTAVRCERCIAALVCSPDSDADRQQLRKLLLIGLGLVLIFQTASLFEFAPWEPVTRMVAVRLRLFGIGLTCLAICVTSLTRFS
jgi:hypothetical protein